VQRTSFRAERCPIARSLDRVGEWWSILILREALRGSTRFDEFHKSLHIAPSILTRRLNALVAAGLFERRRYQEHPPRHAYVLTQAGRDFHPVLVALMTWGNKYFAPEGPSVVLADTATGRRAQPVLVDRVTGRRITARTFALAPGPAATRRLPSKAPGGPATRRPQGRHV
jgi:DNA-binding HxlR family transcriptional regulator